MMKAASRMIFAAAARAQEAVNYLDVAPIHITSTCAVPSRPASGGTLSHHSKIVFGVLIAILCLNRVAVQRRLARKSEVALVVPLCVATRTLPSCGLMLGRPSSLRLIPHPLIHSVILPYLGARAKKL